MKISKKLSVILAAAALCAAAAVGFTLAYFTDSKRAEGAIPVQLEYSTEISEEASDTQKVISIKNTGETDVQVRVLLFYEDRFVSTISASDGWTQGEDAWYYQPVLEPGASTTEITVKLNTDQTKDEDFDIVVTQEAIPATSSWAA